MFSNIYIHVVLQSKLNLTLKCRIAFEALLDKALKQLQGRSQLLYEVTILNNIFYRKFFVPVMSFLFLYNSSSYLNHIYFKLFTNRFKSFLYRRVKAVQKGQLIKFLLLKKDHQCVASCENLSLISQKHLLLKFSHYFLLNFVPRNVACHSLLFFLQNFVR